MFLKKISFFWLINFFQPVLHYGVLAQASTDRTKLEQLKMLLKRLKNSISSKVLKFFDNVFKWTMIIIIRIILVNPQFLSNGKTFILLFICNSGRVMTSLGNNSLWLLTIICVRQLLRWQNVVRIKTHLSYNTPLILSKIEVNRDNQLLCK